MLLEDRLVDQVRTERQIAEAKAAKEAQVAEAKAKKETAKHQAVAQASAQKQGSQETNAATEVPEASAMAAEPQPRMLKRIWNKMFGS